MLKSSAPEKSVRFGAFEFDSGSRELRKHGTRIKLQGQPIDVLAMLVQRPGEVVTREELQKRLWPADTYVDFEHSLNAAIKRLRAALGDSAREPRFVETLARQGYRFIAPLSLPAEEIPPVATPEIRPAPPDRRLGWLPTTVLGVVLILFAGVILTSIRNSRKRIVAGPIRALVVLPLANLSGDREQDFFVDGMTDALRYHLEGIGALRVISRTSAMHYRGGARRVADIARELNVDAVVDGSVLRSGDKVRINVELIQAADDRLLWSNSYDAELRDIFSLQAAVAQKIADEIRVTLTPPDRARLTRPTTSNPDAYLAYSKGRFFWNKRTSPDLEKAIGFFQQAVALDPNYALAYDGLADSYLPLGWYGFLSPADTFPHAKDAVNKALSLDDSLAEAHTTLAFVSLYYDRGWAGAEREFRRAIELNPNYANAHHWYAEYLSLLGRHKEAIAESQRAREIDPLSVIINAWVSSRYFYARQYDKAVEEARNAVEMDQKFAPAHFVLGQAYEQNRLQKEAIAEFGKATDLGRGSPLYAGSLAHALGAAGRQAEARKVIDGLERTAKSRIVPSYDLAVAYLGIGDSARALDLLTDAVRERSPRVVFVGVDPRFDALRNDPRFRNVMQSLGL
jgi:TolB-like protein/DNA-binding winged helix-turn-helix (wHTH) protein/Flp pilus assembly protein TadD